MIMILKEVWLMHLSAMKNINHHAFIIPLNIITCLYIKLEAQEAEPVSLTCHLAKKFQRRFFNESANQKQDLSGGLVFLPLG